PQGQRPCCEWRVDGTRVSQASGPERHPVVRAGNGGGAFVAWEDGRDLATNGYDLYAQAFTSDGHNADVGPGPSAEIAGLLAPTPNPSYSSTRVQLDLVRDADVRVEVYDI